MQHFPRQERTRWRLVQSMGRESLIQFRGPRAARDCRRYRDDQAFRLLMGHGNGNEACARHSL
jgi:hypothetical protein